VSQARVERLRSLLEVPSPAVLTTYRKDGSAHTVPVWFRWADDAFEVVIAKGDVKLRHLARYPRCVLVVFEAVRPFRGLEVRGVAELIEGDVTSARPSRNAISAWVTASALPPNGDPRQECSSDSSPTVRGYGICRASCHPDRPWTASTRRCAGGFGPAQLASCLPWHPILHRMRLDHPDDHPDDRSVSVGSRLDRRAIQHEQARSVWSRPDFG
jgi:hypothetical protein